MHLQFQQLLASPSSLLARALPTLGSRKGADSVNSNTVGVMNKISDTVAIPFSRGSSQPRD